MTLNDFLNFVKTGQALSSPEIHELMNRMSNEARKITFRLNSAYHTPEEVNALLSDSPRSIPISGRTFRWVRTYSSTPAAISRTTAV